MTVIDLANAEQLRASDPAISAFVAASAGSGKTKLLTDRLLRLMLNGTKPQKILCLTYTKAAAAEMTIRLNRRLGAWVVMPEAKLAAELAALDVPATAQTIDLARKLFAEVLDLPGGMRIGTIHAFCQSLLRRFPLEAGLSPHFEVADDADANLRLREAREAILAESDHRGAIAALAAETDEQSFAELAWDFAQAGETLPAATEIATSLRAALGALEESSADIRTAIVSLPREAALRDGLRRVAELGNPSGRTWALTALDWLALPPEGRVAAWAGWRETWFTKGGEGEARTLRGYFGKQLAAEEDGLRDEFTRECTRVAAAQEALRAAQLQEINSFLLGLMAPLLARERTQKQLAARLSYGDLVNYTGELLVNPGAAWILYKLDGGIDHVLLDEVQDTAPAQWEIADAIGDEFFSGLGAQERKRSIFAVGDAKQSIFSFQGADLQSFEHYREKFRHKVQAAGEDWLDGRLSVSFRSTAPVLELTDAVFAQGAARRGVCLGDEPLRHGVSRAGQAGSVTLWPLTQESPASEVPAWSVPDAYETADSAKTRLARQIAGFVATRLGQELPSRGRIATPGDFLVLVRRRDALVSAITSALKGHGIPVAGLDRMVLTEQASVSDLLALCDALLLPEDDLAFAHYLASPLGGLSDESLMELALHRRGKLVSVLFSRAAERPDWQEARAFFEAMRSRVDYLTPFALLSEALGPLGGRAKLLRRLGAEAAEPIDEFLAEALNFSQSSPGSLQLFLHQLRQSGASIKREAEAGGDVVRIMTVHGAKGLQAPIVILPDTTTLPKMDKKLFRLPVPDQENATVPVFCPRGALRSEALEEAARQATLAMEEEYNRLLYVALTRAEDELVICGAEGKRAAPETCWYESVKAGFSRLDKVVSAEDRLVYACAQSAAPDRVAARREAAAMAALPPWAGATPDWTGRPPAGETTRPERIAPSRGTDDERQRAIAASPLGLERAQSQQRRAAALARGQAVHALLQHLPDLPPPARQDAARRYLANDSALSVEADSLCEAVMTILGDPTLAPLFAPGAQAEVPLAGVLGDVEIAGIVDRLAVTEDAVWLADFKTDRQPPAGPEDIPPKYLQQLAAYRAILAKIFPAKDIHCLLIWTESAHSMRVTRDRLDPYVPA
jgi:ATP-dependent helicase/nuclease subunit A